MNKKKTELGTIFIAYTNTPAKPLKTFNDAYHAFHYAKKISKSDNKKLSVYQLENEPQRLVKLCSF